MFSRLLYSLSISDDYILYQGRTVLIDYPHPWLLFGLNDPKTGIMEDITNLANIGGRGKGPPSFL